MSSMTVSKKVNAFNDYIASVPNRDRVLSVVQFTAMALMDPAAHAGCPKLSHDLKIIMELVAQYRAITRFSQWFVVLPQLTPDGIRDVIRNSPSKLAGILKTISTACFTVFVLGEEINLFSKYGCINRELGKKWNRARYVFLFYSNVARLIMNFVIYRGSTFDSTKATDARDAKKAADHKRKVLSLADSVLQTMFAYCLLKGSVPAGPKYLKEAIKSGDVVSIITSLAPPVKIVSPTPHGILGNIASIPGFMMSVM